MTGNLIKFDKIIKKTIHNKCSKTAFSNEISSVVLVSMKGKLKAQ